MSEGRGTLLLLPALLADTAAESVLPQATLEAARRVRYVLAESAKSARALLKAVGHPLPIAQIAVVEIGHAPASAHIDDWLQPLLAEGAEAALVSEAGCPGVADPGADIVARAHRLGIRVRPLVGPSSILLALMAAGFNGQRFRFLGYLPREVGDLDLRLRDIEQRSMADEETQLFIETPYRNERLLQAILAACRADTLVAVAVDLTSTDEAIAMHSIAEWRRLPPSARPSIARRPAVFALMATPRQAASAQRR